MTIRKLAKKWLSPKPEKCQTCNRPFKAGDMFIDGAMQLGSWALMCESCHQVIGCGFGIGRGQGYDWSTCLKVIG